MIGGGKSGLGCPEGFNNTETVDTQVGQLCNVVIYISTLPPNMLKYHNLI